MYPTVNNYFQASLRIKGVLWLGGLLVFGLGLGGLRESSSRVSWVGVDEHFDFECLFV